MALNVVLKYWNSADTAKSRSRRVAFGLSNLLADFLYFSAALSLCIFVMPGFSFIPFVVAFGLIFPLAFLDGAVTIFAAIVECLPKSTALGRNGAVYYAWGFAAAVRYLIFVTHLGSAIFVSMSFGDAMGPIYGPYTYFTRLSGCTAALALIMAIISTIVARALRASNPFDDQDEIVNDKSALMQSVDPKLTV